MKIKYFKIFLVAVIITIILTVIYFPLAEDVDLNSQYQNGLENNNQGYLGKSP
ncbi:MAG: hypothetical protein LBU40_02880 [Methanobrevibacter sp.]|jgi:uncharacterized membrane protein YjgN (DUF898 family)|nr:hypothetical protein [Methanobrevibacter sp.]